MAIYLGIDGGGTKTLCHIGDERSVLGSGVGGGSNVIRLGDARARKSIHDAITQACESANVNAAQIRRACVGLAGAEQPKIADSVRRILAEIIPGSAIEIVTDAVITLHAACGRGPGIIVIAGTGSVAYGRNAAGQIARSGGWGFAVSDEGSGHWIGRSALAAIFRAADENNHSGELLLDAILKSWGIETLDDLVLAANASPPPNFAELFPAVLSASDAGDKLAMSILSLAGVELARFAKILANNLFPDYGSTPVAMAGGVLSNSPLIREVFCNELRRDCPRVIVNPTIAEPVNGALDMARNSG